MYKTHYNVHDLQCFPFLLCPIKSVPRSNKGLNRKFAMQAEEESGDVASVDGSGDLHPAPGGDIGVGAGHFAEQQLHPGPRRRAQVRMRLHGVLELRHEVQLDQELQLHHLFVLTAEDWQKKNLHI